MFCRPNFWGFSNIGPKAWSTYAELLVVARALESDELANRVRLGVGDLLQSRTSHELGSQTHGRPFYPARVRKRYTRFKI